MLFEQARYFVAIVRNDSFTKAAEQCYVSQSAISQQIQALEESIGVPLIIRGSRKFRLTPAGEFFYRQSVSLLDEVERLRRETRRIGGARAERLRFGYQKSYAGEEIRRSVASFSKQYPDEPLVVTGQTHEELSALLRNGDIDLSLNDCRRKPSDLYESLPVFTSQTYAEISPLNPLSEAETITLDELRNVPCVLVSSRAQQKNEREYYRNALGFRGSFLFTEDLSEGRMLAAAGSGFLLVEGRQGQKRQEEELRRIPLWKSGAPVTRPYRVFWKKENESPASRALASLLVISFSY